MLFRIFRSSPSAYAKFQDLWEGEFETKGGRIDLECSVYAIEPDFWIETCLARMLNLCIDPPKFVGGVDLVDARLRPSERPDPDETPLFEYQRRHHVLPFEDESALRRFVECLLEDIREKRGVTVYKHDPAEHETLGSVIERKLLDPAWKEAWDALAVSSSRLKKWNKLRASSGSCKP